MAKAVLISIRPGWVDRILSGKKTLEVRKNRPKLETPFKCYIYCTRAKHEYEDYFVVECDDYGCVSKDFFGGGHVVCEFLCDTIFPIQVECSSPVALGAGIEVPGTCLTDREILEYLGNGKQGFAWHISKLEIYDTPKELNKFWFPPELYCEKERCGGCPYDQVADVNGEYSFDCEWKRPLTRPPQSWCYVEGLE